MEILFLSATDELTRRQHAATLGAKRRTTRVHSIPPAAQTRRIAASGFRCRERSTQKRTARRQHRNSPPQCLLQASTRSLDHHIAFSRLVDPFIRSAYLEETYHGLSAHRVAKLFEYCTLARFYLNHLDKLIRFRCICCRPHVCLDTSD